MFEELLNTTYVCSVAVVFLILLLNLVCVKGCDTRKPLTIHAIFCTTLLTFTIPLAASAYVVFYSIWAVIGLILRMIYRNEFVGFLSGYDAMHARSPIGKSCINILLMVECEDETLPEEIFKSVSNTIAKAVLSTNANVQKLCSTMCSRFGYRFLLKRENVQIVDCVKKMKNLTRADVLTRNDLTELLVYHTKQPFPFDDQLLWDVHVGAQPVQWKNVAPGKKYYPIVFRFNHCAADGVNIFDFITGVCGYSDQKERQAATPPKRNRLIKLLELTLETLLFIILIPAIAYTSSFTRNGSMPSDPSTDTGGPVFLHVEEQQVYFKKMQKIAKNRDVALTSVLIAAFSASVGDYYKSKSQSCPEYVTSTILKHSGSFNLRTLNPGSKSVHDVNFKNEYEAMFVRFPIQPKDVPNPDALSMVDRLDLVMNSLNSEKTSFLFPTAVNRFMKIHFTICPEPVLKLSTYFLKYGAVISNIPGTPKMCFGEAFLPISDYFFYVSGVKRMLFILTLTSYDDRLHLAIGTSSGMKVENLETLLSNTHRYIDVLEKEVAC